VLHEDPSSDSGIAAQKDEATSIERQLAALEGELAHGGMIGAKVRRSRHPVPRRPAPTRNSYSRRAGPPAF
jgi:hypothetical protein